MDPQLNRASFQQPAKASYSDQLFLLNFVMSSYIGPDVYSDNPRCSSYQRLAKRLPPYTSNNLGSSFLSVSQLESLYYYILRNAPPNLVLKPNVFYMYLKGVLVLASSGPVEEDRRQFTSFFPLNLHEHKKYSSNHEIVKGIVLIDDPITSYPNEDLERFKYLTGIDDLRIDAKECLKYQHGYRKDREETESTCTTNSGKKIAGNICNGNEKSSAMFGKKYRRRLCDDPKSIPEFPCNGSDTTPAVTPPTLEDCISNKSIIFTGSVRKGLAGSEGHLVDIGVSEDAYFFRVALPGVRRDFCEFGCEIKSNGEVHIEGTMSGGRRIRKRSRVFRMEFRQLWAAGPFAYSFNLPGAVDPRMFYPMLRDDGIFEGVVIKYK